MNLFVTVAARNSTAQFPQRKSKSWQQCEVIEEHNTRELKTSVKGMLLLHMHVLHCRWIFLLIIFLSTQLSSLDQINSNKMYLLASSFDVVIEGERDEHVHVLSSGVDG